MERVDCPGCGESVLASRTYLVFEPQPMYAKPQPVRYCNDCYELGLMRETRYTHRPLNNSDAIGKVKTDPHNVLHPRNLRT